MNMPADQSLPPMPLQKDAADLRRDQLTAIASRLIEEEGIDAVKHTRIAKMAGCTRSLVYHYFPKRSDIFAAINARFYEALDALIPVADQQQALLENVDGAKENSLLLFSVLFDLLENGHWGSLILRTTPELSSDFASYVDSIHDEFEMRWIRVIAERFNMSEVDGELFFQHSMNLTRTIFLFYRKGLLGRDEAVQKIDETLNQLLNPFR